MSAYKGYFQGIGNMTSTAVSQVGEQILNIIFSLLLHILMGRGVSYGAAGGTIGTVVGAVGASLYFVLVYKRYSSNHIHKKNEPGVNRLSNKRIVKSILKYAFPITIASALQNSGALGLKNCKVQAFIYRINSKNSRYPVGLFNSLQYSYINSYGYYWRFSYCSSSCYI